ncbi:MAG: hypothetical protein IPN36_14980 [Bacteroidetes bacterium]|nr:hypothetical protein [Bacteroidota bacterium]
MVQHKSSGITDGITSICTPSPDTAYAVSTASANGGKITATKNGTNWNQQFSSPKFADCLFPTTPGMSGRRYLPEELFKNN